jgi:hypothetical protein
MKMDKICENCKSWLAFEEGAKRRCIRWIVDRGNGTILECPPEDGEHLWDFKSYLATVPEFGCPLWEERGKPVEPFFIGASCIVFKPALDQGPHASNMPLNDTNKVVAWLNWVWETYKKQDVTEIITVGVYRTFPNTRGLEYQPYIRFGDVQLDLGDRWYSEEEARSWLNGLKERIKCQP